MSQGHSCRLKGDSVIELMNDEPVDYYEILQISANAEPDTIHRVYRLLAQRLHPDNVGTGNEEQFRALSEAYRVLSDPESRAKYDVVHLRQRQDRWRLVSSGADAENDFEIEQHVRLTVLEVLYTRRRAEPSDPGVTPLDLEKLIGRAREHLEFTIWYLNQKKWITRSDNSALVITADGADFLEKHYHDHLHRKRLTAAPAAAVAASAHTQR
jgi:curved DNA-binding protein